jgi:O-acetyl-ADP-ribose deacetylase (regulator of RNase III)
MPAEARPSDHAICHNIANAMREDAGSMSLANRVHGGTPLTWTFDLQGGAPSAFAPRIQLLADDIVEEATDAVVVPTGGFVDLAIRRVAGHALSEAFRDAVFLDGGLAPGRSVVTPGFGLRAKYIVHCAPPLYAKDSSSAHSNLVSCHRDAMRLARDHRFASIAFPALGTGVRGYPVQEAASAALAGVIEDLREHGAPGLVRFVLFGPSMLEFYLEAARARFREDGRAQAER